MRSGSNGNFSPTPEMTRVNRLSTVQQFLNPEHSIGVSMFSKVEVRGRVSIAPMVGDGPSGEMVAFLLEDDPPKRHAERARLDAGHPSCEIICEGALARRALACVAEGALVVVTGALRASQPPGLEGSDLCVLRVEAEVIECRQHHASI
jgi:hypothetical protein